MARSRTLEILRLKAAAKGLDYDAEVIAQRNEGKSWETIRLWIHDTLDHNVSMSWLAQHHRITHPDIP